MIKTPSSRRKRKPDEKINLVPIMDSIFIFIFFLLMSVQFIKVMEIGSNVPIVSDKEPPKKEKDPLALTLKIEENELVLTRGLDSTIVKKFGKLPDGKYDTELLHTTLLSLKKDNLDEDMILFEPNFDVTYEDLTIIMDAVRVMRRTDEALFRPGKDGIDEKLKTLFAKIIFSNLMS